jgi:hypothetical protein
MVEDGNLRTTHQWLFTKFDIWNRPIMDGLYTDNTHLTQTDLQTYASTQNLPLYENLTPGINQGYSINNSFPQLSSVAGLMKCTYYDDYAWTSLYGAQYGAKDNSFDNLFITPSNSSYPYSQPLTQSKLTKGLITGIWTRIVNDPTNTLLHVNFYDDRERLIQEMSTNISGGTDITTMQYGFTGILLRQVTRHQKNGTNAQTYTLTSNFTYDHQDRLLSQSKVLSYMVGGQTLSKTLAPLITHTYNELGQLASKSLGSNLETLNFDYTVRGWLSTVNRQYISGGFLHQLFWTGAVL